MAGEVRMQDLGEWGGGENGNQAGKVHVHKQVDVVVTRQAERRGGGEPDIGVASGSQLSSS